jgi:hypothetical protein
MRATRRGDRTAEFRPDRGQLEGHRILLQEYDPAEDRLTGDEQMLVVRHVTRGPDHGVPRGFVSLSVAVVTMPVHVKGDLELSRRRRDARGAEDL